MTDTLTGPCLVTRFRNEFSVNVTVTTDYQKGEVIAVARTDSAAVSDCCGSAIAKIGMPGDDDALLAMRALRDFVESSGLLSRSGGC